MSALLAPCPVVSAPAIAMSSFGELSGLPRRLSEADCRAAVDVIPGAAAVRCHECRLWFGTFDTRRGFCSRACRLAKAARAKRQQRARRRNRRSS